jgi:hypothetical protein
VIGFSQLRLTNFLSLPVIGDLRMGRANQTHWRTFWVIADSELQIT